MAGVNRPELSMLHEEEVTKSQLNRNMEQVISIFVLNQSSTFFIPLFDIGQNKHTVTSMNTAKLDRETEELKQ